MNFRRGFIGLVLALLALAGCEQAVTGGGPAVDASKAVTVGLLVPLGSDNPQTEQLAASLVNAARLAQADIAGAEIDLRVYPTSGTGAGAQAAAGQAIGEGARIILGPLFSAETAAVAPLAAEAGVPVIAFTNNPSVAGGSTWVLGTTYGNVSDRLVNFAAARGLREIAVVHPEGVDGEAGRDAISTAVTGAGSVFAGAAEYPLAIDAINAAAGPIAAQLRAAGARAVVFTDTPTGGLGFITAALRGAGLGASAVQFMGLSHWDSSLEVLAQPSLGGGWFALPDPGLSGEFAARYLAAYGSEPHDLSGIAYDAVAAAGALLSDARQTGDGNAFSAARITDPAGFVGVNGIFRFLADGSNQRGLAVMQVQDGVAITVDPAPRSFASPQS